MDLKRRDFLSATAAAATLAAARPLLAQTTQAPAPRTAPPPAAPAAPSASASQAPTEVKKIEIVNLRELEAAAQKVLSEDNFRYISRAVGEEWTKRENEAAFKRATIVPRYLTGYVGHDLTTTLLGSKLSMPIIVSAMSGHGRAHGTGEAGTAKGADAAGTLFTTGMYSTVPLEEVARASSGPKWSQIFMLGDRDREKELLLRAKAAGYRAIVLTLDGVVPSNLRGNTVRSPLPSWDDVAFIQEVTGLPVLLKGVLSAETASEAVEHGCAGIQVSNHGGRVLDDMPATFTVLPRIAEAVAGRIPIIMDGGIRRGQDVFKALALGADAVAIGRPILYGLALGGWMGVQGVLEHLKGELEMTMRIAGARSIREISNRFLSI